MEEILKSENQVMLVAEDSETGLVIGFAHVVFMRVKAFSCLKPQTNIYLQDLVVSGDYRNRGIGTLLLNEAKKYGTEKGADSDLAGRWHPDDHERGRADRPGRHGERAAG